MISNFLIWNNKAVCFMEKLELNISRQRSFKRSINFIIWLDYCVVNSSPRLYTQPHKSKYIMFYQECQDSADILAGTTTRNASEGQLRQLDKYLIHPEFKWACATMLNFWFFPVSNVVFLFQLDPFTAVTVLFLLKLWIQFLLHQCFFVVAFYWGCFQIYFEVLP